MSFSPFSCKTILIFRCASISELSQNIETKFDHATIWWESWSRWMFYCLIEHKLFRPYPLLRIFYALGVYLNLDLDKLLFSLQWILSGNILSVFYVGSSLAVAHKEKGVNSKRHKFEISCKVTPFYFHLHWTSRSFKCIKTSSRHHFKW